MASDAQEPHPAREPGELEANIGDFVAYYNHLRYHESIANLAPADVYFGRGQTILLERERIKRHTIENPTLELPPNRRLTSLNRCARASLPHKPVLTLFI
jgi:hypothetical protein